MKIMRTAGRGLTGIFCAGFLQSCGGYHAGSAAMTPTSISISVTPTSVIAGRGATLMWSATGGTSCMASGAWSGTQSTSGTMTVTPTSAGSEVFTLTCSSGIYSSNNASAMLTVTAASAATVTELVANVAGGTAAHVDTNLVNPWGVSIPAAPSTAPAWVSNNGSQTSTLYDGNGVPQPVATPLIVNLAASAGGAAFDPTGIVANSSSTDFMVSAAGKSGSSAFIFDGAGGMIAGWSPGVDVTHAITMYADAGGALYKGLAIAANNGALFLYATDFHNNKIDVFDTNFVKQATSSTDFTFADPAIPAGYAPFGIQAVPGSGTGGATQIFVTYAQQVAPANATNANGTGLGFVDIYDTKGKFIKQLIAGGALNAPLGIAVAPADFGTFSKALLVANFGDGKINAYDAAAGTPLGMLADINSGAAAAPGLLGIAFGNDANSQPHNTLFFAAGPNGGADGVYGRIDLTGP
ncbi:MAG: TIGR03118 family protein [Steroidobacteraceae bacterium]